MKTCTLFNVFYFSFSLFCCLLSWVGKVLLRYDDCPFYDRCTFIKLKRGLFRFLTIFNEFAFSVTLCLFYNMGERILKALCSWTSMKRGVCWFRYTRDFFSCYFPSYLWILDKLFIPVSLMLCRLQLAWLWLKLHMSLSTGTCIGLVTNSILWLHFHVSFPDTWVRKLCMLQGKRTFESKWFCYNEFSSWREANVCSNIWTVCNNNWFHSFKN